jgi:hypothetical protein
MPFSFGSLSFYKASPILVTAMFSVLLDRHNASFLTRRTTDLEFVGQTTRARSAQHVRCCMSDDLFADIHADLEADRARKLAAKGTRLYSTAEWQRRANAFLSEYDTCLCCGGPADVADHIVPLGVGGSVDGELQPACKQCHDVVKRKLDLLYKHGNCTQSDLRLNSKLAQQIKRNGATCDVNGIPLSSAHPWRREINNKRNKRGAFEKVPDHAR